MGRMMNLLELGALLKDEREKRGLSLRDVMEATKISRRNLTALEGGEVEQLPHPVYLKGYVRNYAKLVGLEAEPLVAVVEAQMDGGGYLPQAASASSSSAAAPVVDMASSAAAPIDDPASPDSSEPALQPGAVSASEPQEFSEASATGTGTDAPERSESFRAASSESAPLGVAGAAGRPRLLAVKNARAWPWVVLLVIALLAALVYVQYRRVSHEMDAAPANSTTAAPTNATAVPAAAPAVPAESAPTPADNASAASSNAAEPAGQPNTAAAPADQGAAQSGAQVAGSSFDGSRKAGPGQADQNATPGKQLLVVTAKPNEVCWVSLSEGSHHKTFILKHGDSRRFEFSKKAKLRLGNAGGVTVQLNGAPYPFEGQRGSTATLEIGAK